MYSYSRFSIVFLLHDPKNKSIQIPAESNVSQLNELEAEQLGAVGAAGGIEYPGCPRTFRLKIIGLLDVFVKKYRTFCVNYRTSFSVF